VIVNLTCAGLAGSLVPLGLKSLGLDPAVASSVFVTWMTDTLGFLAFLGIASAILFHTG
jgi:magnesium transporter